MTTRAHRHHDDEDPRYLTAAECAERRRMKEASLAQERYRGDGPPFIKDGHRVLYPADLLEEYLLERLCTPGRA